MMKRSKRYQKRSALVEPEKSYSLSEAVKILKKVEPGKADETISLNFQLGIKAEAGDENVRGTVSLPHGSGRSVRVLCFTKGETIKDAEASGADIVGGDELVEKVKNGFLDFDVVVAHPDMMREVSKLGRVLGPKGLMPTPKTGTVTPQIGKAVKELKAGRIEFKSDKTAGLHAVCGKLSFSEEALLENARAVIKAVRDSKPPISKGEYLKSVTISATQGPGLKLNTGAL
ncbi:MAG TPA: 50S ribosomal protein L1 [Candidatus Omnitrophota bacterium]|nr:50S ribosomal protein L1 [Candidatus Omnitrophota bacterium]HPW64886.1 50S ribosomal protein L1 [Candidatus Omnitrophota bacterium]HQB93827.1 50S ribosomal protein L1 [Candidatus Omnitrophota bacterium]